MKKIVLSTVCVLLLLLGLVSCAKTTKTKLVGDWNVTSQIQNTSNTYSDGDIYRSDYEMTETAVNLVKTNTIGGVTTVVNENGKMKQNTVSFNKDGSFIWITNYSTNTNIGAAPGVLHQLDTYVSYEGSWNFLLSNKAAGTKKNEEISI